MATTATKKVQKVKTPKAVKKTTATAKVKTATSKTTSTKTTAVNKTAEKLQRQIKLLKAKKQGIAEQIAAKQTALTAAKTAAKKA